MLDPVGDTLGLRGLLRRQIPDLRRFGGVVCGCQRQADSSVLLLMKELVHIFELDELTVPSRAALYKRFLQILSFGLDRRGLPLPSPVSRQANLLVSVEKFSPEEAARILEVPVAELPAMLAASAREQADGKRARVLIIEDEPLIAMELKRYSVELGHVVSGTARTRNRAMQIARRDNLDLILSDVRLGHGSTGGEVVRAIQGEQDVPVIFITGFPEVLLSNQLEEPLFLVTKPYSADAVKAMISQALFLRNLARESETTRVR